MIRSNVADFLTSPSVNTQKVANAVDAFLTSSASGRLGKQLLASPIQLIGHSYGGSLISALAGDLGMAGVCVDQLTTLDPASNLIGNPPATVWSNVAFADNYWEYAPSLGFSFLDEAIKGADNIGPMEFPSEGYIPDIILGVDVAARTTKTFISGTRAQSTRRQAPSPMA